MLTDDQLETVPDGLRGYDDFALVEDDVPCTVVGSAPNRFLQDAAKLTSQVNLETLIKGPVGTPALPIAGARADEKPAADAEHSAAEAEEEEQTVGLEEPEKLEGAPMEMFARTAFNGAWPYISIYVHAYMVMLYLYIYIYIYL